MSELPVTTNRNDIVGVPTASLTSVLASNLSIARKSASVVVPYLSYGAQRIGTLGVVGISLCVFSVFTFFSGNLPLHQKYADSSLELNRIRNVAEQARSGTTAASPQQQATKFVADLPTVNDVPAVMGSIVAVAAASGIEFERGTYEYVASDGDTIARYQMSLPVVGSYPEIRQFVENVLATVPTVALDSMRIERGKVSESTISADLKFSILLGGVS